MSADLEDWLTEAGDRVVRKLAAHGEAALSQRERLLYEIWLLDTEARNGGLSQYFCNRGLAQWRRCAAAAATMPGFAPFAARVAALLAARPGDPYLAVLDGGADGLYHEYQEAIVRELRSDTSR